MALRAGGRGSWKASGEFQYQQGDVAVAAAELMKSAIRHKGSMTKIKVVSSDLLYGGSNLKLLPICGAALPKFLLGIPGSLSLVDSRSSQVGSQDEVSHARPDLRTWVCLTVRLVC